jgi:hypothetical protein
MVLQRVSHHNSAVRRGVGGRRASKTPDVDTALGARDSNPGRVSAESNAEDLCGFRAASHFLQFFSCGCIKDAN